MGQGTNQPQPSLVNQITTALRHVLGEDAHALHEPLFQGNEQLYVQRCITSTFVSSVGAYVDLFEKQLAEYTGAVRAIAVVNGTAALQIALQLAGVKAGEEVIVPALSFVATANAVRYLGATPHFADSCETTLGLDPYGLRDWLNHSTEHSIDGFRNKKTGCRIRALVPMHTFGHPCDLDALSAIAHDFQLIMVEDAAESLGSYYCGRHTGTIGRLGTLSFNGNKIVTTGGGGAILTNDVRLADHAKHLTTTAKVPHAWAYEHDEVGYNFRMPNLNAALGCAQLEQLPNFLASKRRLTDAYRKVYSVLNGVALKLEPPNCQSNYWLQTLLLEESEAYQKEAIIEATNDRGFMTRPAWTLLPQLQPYRTCPSAPTAVAESLVRRIINLPSSAGIT